MGEVEEVQISQLAWRQACASWRSAMPCLLNTQCKHLPDVPALQEIVVQHCQQLAVVACGIWAGSEAASSMTHGYAPSWTCS
jgi:hypothetical protein